MTVDEVNRWVGVHNAIVRRCVVANSLLREHGCGLSWPMRVIARRGSYRLWFLDVEITSWRPYDMGPVTRALARADGLGDAVWHLCRCGTLDLSAMPC